MIERGDQHSLGHVQLADQVQHTLNNDPAARRIAGILDLNIHLPVVLTGEKQSLLQCRNFLSNIGFALLPADRTAGNLPKGILRHKP